MNDRLFHPVVVLLTVIILAGGCEDPDVVRTYRSGETGIFIGNEGNFTFGNASLSYYDPDSMKVQNQVFFNTNLFPVGDVLQSITIKDTLAFLVVNNSGKIQVISSRTFKHVATIKGLISPRYIITDDRIAYVSDLHSGSIAIVDLNTFEITGSIPVGRSTEQILQIGEQLIAVSWSGNNKVYRIDINDRTVTDSLTVALQPNSMVLDRDDRLWVLSDGAYPGSPFGNETAALTVIDPGSFRILKTFPFPGIEYSPSRLSINSRRDTLFFLNGGWTGNGNDMNGVCRMPVDETELPASPFIRERDRLFYGLGIDPANSDIYVSDAMDYLRKGWVFRYNSSGTAVDSFRVDIAPSSFCFKTGGSQH